MNEMTIAEFKKHKEKAEAGIRDAVSRIFEDFKSTTNSHFTNQTIHIEMVYCAEMGHKKPEAIVSGATIDMEIF